MKELLYFVGVALLASSAHALPYFGLNIQTSTLTGANYGPATTAGTFFSTAAANVTTFVNMPPMLTTMPYQGYDQFWPLNNIAVNFGNGVGKTAIALAYVMNNLTLAAADLTLYPSIFTNLTISISNAMTLLNASSSSIGIPKYAQASLDSLNAQLLTQLTSLSSLINSTQSGIVQFKASGLALSATNLQKYIPSQATVATQLTTLNTLASTYSTSTMNLGANMTNAFNILNSLNSTMSGIANQFNVSVNSMNTVASTTTTNITAQFNTFATSLNNSVMAFINALPAQVKSNTLFNNTLVSIMPQINALITSLVSPTAKTLNGIVSGWLYNNVYIENMFYDNIMKTMAKVRSSLFNNTMTNLSTSTCASAFYTGFNNTINSIGVSNLSTCLTNETTVFPRFTSLLSTYLSNFNAEFAMYMNLLNACPKMPLNTTNSSNPFNYTTIACLTDNLQSISALESWITTMTQTLPNLYQSIALTSIYRVNVCFNVLSYNVQSKLGPLDATYQNCSAPYLQSIQVG